MGHGLFGKTWVKAGDSFLPNMEAPDVIRIEPRLLVLENATVLFGVFEVNFLATGDIWLLN